MAFANDACKAYPVLTALAANLAVQLNASGQAVVCAGLSTDKPIGVTFIASDAAGNVAVFLLGAGVATVQTTAAAVTLGQNVFTAAAGQVSATGTGALIGQAATAVTSAGGLLDVIPGSALRTASTLNYLTTFPLTLTAGTAISAGTVGGISNLIYAFDSTFNGGTAGSLNINFANLAGAINALRSAMVSSTLFS